MSTHLVFNVSKGREIELHNRVQIQDPSTSRIGVMILASAGIEDPATVLIQKATVTALLAGTTNEVSNTGYSRKILTHSDLSAFVTDNANNWNTAPFPNQVWSAISTGDAWAYLVTYYIPIQGTSTDSTCVPITINEFSVTPTGADITASWSNGYLKAA